MHFLNLGILAHVDAGKTSLTERLLYESGAIASLGSVNAGTTRTDSMELERRRGITIRTTVASLIHGDVQVNLIDTPGHADFIAEVERGLAVLDGAVLVVSAVEGVQPQTVVLWRALRRLHLPTLVFVNKIDRRFADPDRVVAEIESRLAAPHDMVILDLGSTTDVGTPAASVAVHPLTARVVVDAVTRLDDRLLGQAVTDEVAPDLVSAAVRRLTAADRMVPVMRGSALTGAGVPDLLELVTTLLPLADRSAGDLSALVFKIDRERQQKIAWARVFSGELRNRTRPSTGDRQTERLTSLRHSTVHGLHTTPRAQAGDVVAVGGLTSARVGDWWGTARPARAVRQFPSPALEAVVEPVVASQRGALHHGLSELAEADPLINVRIDPDRNQLAVSLYGEVQKEVIAALLEEEFGVLAVFGETTTVHVERLLGLGAAHATAARDTPYFATLGLRVEPASPGTGLIQRLEAELGSMPPAFFTATWDGVRTGLAQGRHGWTIPDAVVVITDTGYFPRQSAMHQGFNKNMSSIGADFRNLAPVLIHQALVQAGTVVCEPIERFTLHIPLTALAAVSAALAQTEAVTTETSPGHQVLELSGTIPTRRLREFSMLLPDLARGEAVFTSEPDHYQAVRGVPPGRPRVGAGPG